MGWEVYSKFSFIYKSMTSPYVLNIILQDSISILLPLFQQLPSLPLKPSSLKVSSMCAHWLLSLLVFSDTAIGPSLAVHRAALLKLSRSPRTSCCSIKPSQPASPASSDPADCRPHAAGGGRTLLFLPTSWPLLNGTQSFLLLCRLLEC